MNCKPGDLAVIVNTHPEAASVLGKPIRITQRRDVAYEACWEYEGMPLRGKYRGGNWVWHSIPDEWLRPLRDPGDDARDETLEWLDRPAPREVVGHSFEEIDAHLSKQMEDDHA